MNLVVDASVAVKWFLFEEFHEQASVLLESDDKLFAPDLLLTELANVLWRKCMADELTLENAKTTLSEVQICLPDMRDDLDLAPIALEMAITLEHPVYDCVYLALAEQIDGKVITADRRFYNRLEGTPFRDVVAYLPDFQGAF
jgi:predicted nucleic acid-binding protein